MNRSIFAVLALFAGAAAAQNIPRPDPADPKAPAPAAQYRSPFEGYRPYKEPELASWRKVNAEAGSLGGHQGHVAKPPANKPPAANHGSHGGHK